MATEQLTRPASSAKAPSAKFESFVDQQLTRVKQRLRAVDLGAAALLLLAITLGYAAAMAVFDLVVRGSSESWVGTVRLIAFGVYLLAMAAGAYVLIGRFLRRINPYYCAHQLEQTLSDPKNSVINWLDLKEEHLPPAIRSSLGMKAAKDLKDADAEQVVDPKQTWFMGGLAGAMFVILVIVFALSPNQFGSLLARAFAPFRDISIANRATITLLKPAGDVTVPHNQRVDFLAQIDGRFPKVNDPQAPTLWYRYAPGDPFQPMPLEEDGNGQWGAIIAADQVQNGFWYKITAADASTEIYQVSTRSRPEAKQFEVTYRYRPYRKLTEQTIVYPNEHAIFPELGGHRGTEVTVLVRTNQPVRDGRLQLEFPDFLKEVPGERIPDDPKAFRCKFSLERSGQYRVIFTTQSQESNADRDAYRIEVLDDLVPAVVMTKPAQDVAVPANGTLTVTGHAQDDFGVQAMALHLRVLEGADKPALAPQPYRPAKKFQFDTGEFPTKLDYLDVLAVDQIKTEQGAPFAATPGMILEYWLEATDNADYPSATGNVGKSQAYKLKIEPPQDPKKQKDDRQQAQDQQKKHDKQQDQQHKKENDQKKQDEADKNSGKSPDERQAEQVKKDRDDVANKVKKELDKEEEQKNQGQGKGNEPPKSDNKSNDGQQPSEANQKDSKAGKEPQQAGDKKDDGKQDGKKKEGPPAAEAKGPGDQKQKPQTAPEKQQASEPKGPGNEKPQPSAKGQDSEGQSGKQPEQQPASAKGGPKDDAKQPPGESKDDGKASAGGMDKTAQAKENGPKDDKMKQQGPEAKNAQGNKDAPAPQAKNDKKGPDNQAGKKGDTKPGKNEQITKEKGQGNTKPDATASKNPPGTDGERKPAEAKPGEEPVRKAEAKDQGGKGMEETKQGPPAQAKNQPMNPNGKPQQEGAKETPGDQAKESATAKDEKGQAPPREPTMKDLERLKDQLAKGDPEALKTAEELKRNLPENKDAKLGKAAEEMLKGAEKMLDEMARNDPKGNPNAGGTSGNEPMKAESPMNTNAGGNEPNPMTKQGEAPQKTKQGNEPTTTAKNAGGSGPGGENVPDNLKPTAADKEFADRLANLQLEELKNRVTPDTLKRAGVSDEEWEQFLKNAADYERLRAKLQNQPKKEPDKMRAKPGQFAGSGPRAVNNQSTNANPASIGQALAPPELREAQRRFTQQKTP